MELDRIIGWLSAYPGFTGYEWAMDCLPHRPGMVTLCPKGVQVLQTVQDVMGNRKQTLQYTCQLHFSGTGKAQMLYYLQQWVQQQDALGRCPQLGQGRKSARLQDGRHSEKNKLGLDLYTAQLKLTYETYYEVNENGEN